MHFQKRWILLTGAGWIIGIALALMVTPLCNAITGQYLQQTPLPVCMVVIIGIFQSFVLKHYTTKRWQWVWLYLVSFTIGFVIIEGLAEIFHYTPEWYMPVATTVSGLICGYLQARIFLKVQQKDVMRWTMLTAAAWTGTVFIIFGMAWLGQYCIKVIQLVLNLLLIASGGLMLGYFTKNIRKYLTKM